MYQEIRAEIHRLFTKPHPQLDNLVINAIVSLAFFLGSMVIGTVNDKLLPFAATVILLWTLADASLTNQFMFDTSRTKQLKTAEDVRHALLVRNLTVIILTIPLCIVFGIIMAVIIGKWSELLYGLLMALALVWGWLGVSNIMSTHFPFDNLEFKQVLKREKGWFSFSLLYSLPWLLMPAYALAVLAPLRLLGILSDSPKYSQLFLAAIIILAISITIWLISLKIASKGLPRISRKLS